MCSVMPENAAQLPNMTEVRSPIRPGEMANLTRCLLYLQRMGSHCVFVMRPRSFESFRVEFHGTGQL